MKINKYDIGIVDSMLDYAHGLKHTIIEYYIPEYNLIFNRANGDLYAFYDDQKEKRIELKDVRNIIEIEVPDSLCEELKRYVELKKKLKAEIDII